MKKKKKVVKTPVAKKTNKWEAWLINTFTIVLFGGAFIWMGVAVYHELTTEKKMQDQYVASLPNLTDTIDHSKICMVDDVYQGDYPTLPVAVNSKTYYGCSQKAIRDLTTNDSLQFAIDPVSKNKIDKATAIIMIHPKKDGKVMYFGSKQTYNKYLNNLKSRSEER